MQIKMIALDLDNTFLHTDKSVSDYSMAVLDKCREKGIRIAVATARSEKEAEPYLKQIRPDITVSNGGARVRYGEKTVWTCKLSADATAAIISAAVREDHCVNITVDTEDGFYVTWEHPDSPTHAHGIHWDFTNPFRKSAYKLVLELNEAEAAGRIAQGHSECSMTPFSDEKWYRFAHKDATKMEGVRQAAQYLDIDVSQIAAFGDDTSDLDMIRGCGIGVAMQNAIDAVRAAADTVCLSCDEDGVARWIEENIL